MRTTSRVPLLTLALAFFASLTSAFAQAPRFLTPVTYHVPGAQMAVVADVNGDGIKDIITANGFASGGQGVSLLLGNGDGSFQAARQIVATGNPTAVAVADLNGDGKADLVVADGPNTTSVSILFGNGNGTFQAPRDLAVGETESLAVADFNGDGKPDLAVGGASDGVTVLINEGAGNFRTSFTLPANPAIVPILTAGDFNGDGKQDFLIAGGSYDMQLGNGDGTFHDGSLEALPNVIYYTTGDFTGDHRLDIATVSPSRGTTVSEMAFGQPDGTIADSFITNFTAGGSNLVAADFDLDGKLDIFAAGGLSLGHGDGQFQLVGSGFGARPGFPSFAAAGDLDRNGSPDLVVATGTDVLVALNTAGNPPLLAQLTTSASFVVGGTQVTGSLLLGGPAPAGGAVITLTSSNPAGFFPSGSTVTIPAGSSSANFPISTRAVTLSTPVTISARYHATLQTITLTVVPAFHITSVSVTPSSLIGMFGGSPAAVGTVVFSGQVANGTVVALSSSNPSILAVPASVTATPGSTSVNFSAVAQHVAADTAVTVTAAFNGGRQTTTVTVRKETATVTITKAEFTVRKSQLNVEANSTDRVASLQIYNPTTGALVGSIPLVGSGRFVGQLQVSGPFTSVAVQSSAGGAAIANVTQK